MKNTSKIEQARKVWHEKKCREWSLRAPNASWCKASWERYIEAQRETEAAWRVFESLKAY